MNEPNPLPECGARSRFCHVNDQAEVVIRLAGRFAGSTYEVPLDELRRAYGFAWWVRHLAEKVWFTPEVCHDFCIFTARLVTGTEPPY